MPYCVKDVLQALDDLSGGRCFTGYKSWSNESNNFIITKSSNIPGKSVTEIPGLIWGDMDMEVKKLAVIMTLNESVIELAAATGVHAIVAHHPIADVASSGGVLLKHYLNLYNISVFELHEAFHGLHPGIPFLHGHKPFYTNISYGDIHGNIVYVGNALPEIKTVGDMINRLNQFMDTDTDRQLLVSERMIRNCENIHETTIATQCKILLGNQDKLMKKVIHIFPHTGFNADHLESLMKDNPDVDTLLATISRVYPNHELIEKAEKYGLNFVCGNSHASEIFENGLPLAHAILHYLPKMEVVIFRDRVTSTPLSRFGTNMIQDYAKEMALNYLRKQ
jgi:hypothetical protein